MHLKSHFTDKMASTAGGAVFRCIEETSERRGGADMLAGEGWLIANPAGVSRRAGSSQSLQESRPVYFFGVFMALRGFLWEAGVIKGNDHA